MNYIDKILEKRSIETSFIDNKDGTITIRSDELSTSRLILPELDLPKNPRNEKVFAIEYFIKRNYDDKFRLDINNENVIELLNNTDVTKYTNNIIFKPLNKNNEHSKNPQMVLKRDQNGTLQYNDAAVAKTAVNQFKTLSDNIQREQKDRYNTHIELPMLEIQPS